MSLLSTAARTVADWVKLGFPEEVAKRIVSGELPMDKASRMKRAEEQGYDTSTPVYHGTDSDFLEFDPERSSYGQLYSTTDKAAVESGEVGAAGHGVVKELYQNIQNPAGWDEYDNLFIDQIQGRGYDGIKLPDGDHTTMVVFDPKKYKSTEAAFDPQYKGANILGSALLPAATAGLLATQSDDAEAGFVTRGGKTLLEAWHGSPHKFDKFSMDQIGTGEGAQAYGHGLYFADDIDEAKRYQPRDYDQEEELYRLYKEAEEAGDQYMMDAWERAMMQDSPIELRASAADPDYDEYSQAAFAEVADYLESNPGQGSLLRAEIDVTPESMIDWEKSLKEQPEFNEALRKMGYFDRYKSDSLSDSVTGSMAYESIYDWLGDPVKRTEILKENGINGISYPADNPTRGQNHVIFDDSLINIAERGSADPRLLAGIAAGGAGATAAPSLLDMADEYSGKVIDALEMPYKGLLGLGRLGGGLLAGEGIDAAIDSAVKQIKQPIDKTADEVGDSLLKTTGSPEAATLANLLVQFHPSALF